MSPGAGRAGGLTPLSIWADMLGLTGELMVLDLDNLLLILELLILELLILELLILEPLILEPLILDLEDNLLILQLGSMYGMPMKQNVHWVNFYLLYKLF